MWKEISEMCKALTHCCSYNAEKTVINVQQHEGQQVTNMNMETTRRSFFMWRKNKSRKLKACPSVWLYCLTQERCTHSTSVSEQISTGEEGGHCPPRLRTLPWTKQIKTVESIVPKTVIIPGTYYESESVHNSEIVPGWCCIVQTCNMFPQLDISKELRRK